MSDRAHEPFPATVDDLTNAEVRRCYQIAYEPGMAGQPGWLVADPDEIPDSVQWLPVTDVERLGQVVAVTVAGCRFVKDSTSPVVLKDAS